MAEHLSRNLQSEKTCQYIECFTFLDFGGQGRVLPEICRLNREPQSTEDYRSQAVQESERYALNRRDEPHIADHIAFLAQAKEGAKTVSAVALEERRANPRAFSAICSSRNTANTTYLTRINAFIISGQLQM
jgi:hypothetical protein